MGTILDSKTLHFYSRVYWNMFGNTLTFTFYDITGHLIPGALVVLFLIWQYELPVHDNATLTSAGLLVVSYVVGHLFHAVGSWLFTGIYKADFDNQPVIKKVIAVLDLVMAKYQRLILTTVPATDLKMKDQLKSLIKKKLGIQQNLNSLALYDICCNVALKAGYSEKSVLETKEGFYRALVPAMIFCFVVLLLNGFVQGSNVIWATVVTITVIELLRNRREFYRRIKNNQIYAVALLELQGMKK